MKNKIADITILYKHQVKKGGALFLVFLLVKSLVFFAPLSISYLVDSPNLYGQFEYALNLGQTLLSVFSMGLGSALAYFTLKKSAYHLMPAFHFHFLVISLLLLLIIVIFPSLYDNLIFGAAIIGAAFAHQLFNSSNLKLNDRNIASVFVDSGLYFIMALYAIILYTKIISFNIGHWHMLVLSHLVFSNIMGLKNIKGFNTIDRKEYWSIYQYGIFTVFGGLLLFVLSNNTRLFLEYFTTFQEVGIYSFYFRIAALVVILYRVVGILMFKKYFISAHAKIDAFFAFLISGLFLCNIILYAALNLLKHYYPSVFGNVYVSHLKLYPLIVFQVNFWIGIALFESIINRELLTKKFIILLLMTIIMFVVCLYILEYNDVNSIKTIVASNTIFILMANLGQIFILRKSTYFYKKTFIVQLAISIIYILYLTISY